MILSYSPHPIPPPPPRPIHPSPSRSTVTGRKTLETTAYSLTIQTREHAGEYQTPRTSHSPSLRIQTLLTVSSRWRRETAICVLSLWYIWVLSRGTIISAFTVPTEKIASIVWTYYLSDLLPQWGIADLQIKVPLLTTHNYQSMPILGLDCRLAYFTYYQQFFFANF